MRRRSIGGTVATQVAILAAATVLIALIWLGSFNLLRANRAEVEARAAARIAGEVLVFADRIDEHLTAVDETLRAVARDWEADPHGFDLTAWRQRAVALPHAAVQVFIADAGGVVLQATDPGLIGQQVGNRAYFRNRAALPRDDGQMYVGEAMPKPGGDGWVLSLSRRLDRPDGSFAGVVAAYYDLGELPRYFSEAGLGAQGLIELVGELDERLRAAAGDGGTPGQSIAGTPMGRAMARSPDGNWTGPSAPDGVDRVHAFHALPERKLELVLATPLVDALRPAVAWERQALGYVGLTTILVMFLAAALLVEVRAARQRVAVLAHERSLLAAAKADADAKSQRLEATLAGMSDGVMMINAALRLVEWNQRFPEMAGVPPDMLERGTTMEAILRAQAMAGEFGPVDVEAEIATRIAAIRGIEDTVTYERTRPNGRVLSVRRRRLPNGGFVAIFTDITERKRNEDALRQARLLAEAAAAAKSRFAAIVSHEIRQQLNALLNSLSLLAGNEMAPAPRRLVDIAQQSGMALLGLLNDILEMSKMEAGQLTLRPAVFALHPLLQEVADMFADQAASRGMTIRLATAAGTPAWLRADPVRIRQILTNLMSNAVKFASPGTIVLAAEVEADRPGMLRLTVRDPGPAIDPAARARLFQPFVQLGDAVAAGDVGTGLGLAICQTLAGLLGGEIGYRPGEEGGNAFWVTLAFDQAPPPAPTPARAAALRPIHPRSRVLLVDDILANQLVIATMLRRDGHMVDVAASADAAIRAVAREPYDLVLMDIVMPGMSGIEAARRIRALPGPPAVVPICALTGTISAADRTRCEAAGMNDTIAKPVEPDALVDMLGRLVWRRRPTPQPPLGPSPAEEQSTAPLLAASRLAALRANLPPATLAELVEAAIEELGARLQPLQQALSSGDALAIEAEAHAGAGIAGNYAMAALEARLRAIVTAARGGRMAGAASQAAELVDLLGRSAEALRHAVSGAEAAP